jgi:hypothetical protein
MLEAFRRELQGAIHGGSVVPMLLPRLSQPSLRLASESQLLRDRHILGSVTCMHDMEAWTRTRGVRYGGVLPSGIAGQGLIVSTDTSIRFGAVCLLCAVEEVVAG